MNFEENNKRFYIIYRNFADEIVVVEKSNSDYHELEEDRILVDKNFDNKKEAFLALKKLYDMAEVEQKELFLWKLNEETKKEMFFTDLKEKAKHLE